MYGRYLLLFGNKSLQIWQPLFTSFSLSLSIYLRFSMTRLGDFFKVFGNKFANKSSPKILLTFGLICKKINLCKNWCGYYSGNFWKHLGNFLSSTSGHTETLKTPTFQLEELLKTFWGWWDSTSEAEN